MERPRKQYLLEEYQLEPDTQLLSRGGRPIHLPKKPFHVLLHLVECRDRYVSRAELLDLFWDGREVYDDALRKCIGAIRKALDDRSDKPRFVETRWGVGYRYVGPVEEQLVQEESAIVEIEKTREVKIVVEEEEIQDETTASERQAVNPAPALSPPPALKWSPKITAVALIFLAVAIGAVVLISSRQRPDAPADQHPPIRSIAVLPLQNLTGDPANDYLSDGLTERLITALSNIEGLKVISRGSVFTYKAKNVDAREAGHQLGVAAILEGSVLRSDDRARVEVRLVSTDDGRVLWASQAYDDVIENIFDVQDKIARNVVSELKIELSEEVKQRLAKRYTQNVEAYQAYLKGRYFWNQRSAEGLQKALGYFQQAIAKDPNYALAYAGLADCYGIAWWVIKLSPQEAREKAQEAATKAIELDDTSPEAHLSLAVAYYLNWDWTGNQREIARALEINPGDAEAHHSFAYALIAAGRADEALAEVKRAQELDPLSVVLNVDVGEILLYARRYDEAIEALRHAIEMDPSRNNAHWDLGLAYEQKGMNNEAFAEFLQNENLSGASREKMAALREAFEKSGLKGFWRKMLEQTKEESKQKYVPRDLIARLYSHLGEKEEAFAWLDEAYRERSPFLVNLKVDPFYDGLRSDPRFAELERRAGLTP